MWSLLKVASGVVAIFLLQWAAQMMWPQADPRLLLFFAYLAAIAWLVIHYRKNLFREWRWLASNGGRPSKSMLVRFSMVGGMVVAVPVALYMIPKSWLSDPSVAHPRFILHETKIGKLKIVGGGRAARPTLGITFRNNEHTARRVSRRILIIDKKLDSLIKPLVDESRNYADEIGPGQRFYITTTELNISRRLLSSFVVVYYKYENTIGNYVNNQFWFLKFPGAKPDGGYYPALFGATAEEREKIEAYMKKRGIAVPRSKK